MPKILKYKIATLISVKDVMGNEYQDDWRLECIDGQGLLLLKESLYKKPGQQFLTFFYTKDYIFVDDLQTSYGKILLENEKELVFKTRNSTYTFEFKHTLPDSVVDAFTNLGKSEKEKLEKNAAKIIDN